MNKAMFTMLVGLPASGKSTWIKNNKDKFNMVIHSSDAIREELSSINDQSQNELVFNILHKRVKEDLLNGKNVCYDATNLSRKRRIHFINHELRDIPCKKVCVLLATPYEICIKNNANRERKVPEDVIERMIKSFEVPCKQEGWDDIQIVWWDYDGLPGYEYDIEADIEKFKQFDQKNKHHKLSLGNHLEAASKYILNNNNVVTYYASLLHDVGKLYTQTNYNYKREYTEDCHYYNHENVSAYLCLFYLRNKNLNTNDILLISSLILMHMKPYVTYANSKKAYEKDKAIFGHDYMNLLYIIHEADLLSH